MSRSRLLALFCATLFTLGGLAACKGKKEPETLDVLTVAPTNPMVSKLIAEQDALLALCDAEKTLEARYDCVEKAKIAGMGTAAQRKDDLLILQTSDHALFIRNKPGASYHFAGYLPSIHQYIVHQIYQGGASFTLVDQYSARSTPLEGNPMDKATFSFDPAGKRVFDFYPGTPKVPGVMRVLEFDEFDGLRKPGSSLTLCADSGKADKVAARWLDGKRIELTTLKKGVKTSCIMDAAAPAPAAPAPAVQPLPVKAAPAAKPAKAKTVAKAKASAKGKAKAKSSK